jgi:hypothetical protein
LAIAAVLAVLLAAGRGGVLAGIVFGTVNLAAAGGSAAILDLIGFAIYKPIDRIRETADDTQRLEFAILRCKQTLGDCRRLRALQQRIDCQQTVWQSVMVGIETQSPSRSAGHARHPSRRSRR